MSSFVRAQRDPEIMLKPGGIVAGASLTGFDSADWPAG
jgi:hypothetical protein